jgi:heme/copper-type cytochrome/quinol oxidase subunit 2
MRGWIYVHSPEDYQKWAAENLKAEAKPADGAERAAGAENKAAEALKVAELTTGGKAKK